MLEDGENWPARKSWLHMRMASWLSLYLLVLSLPLPTLDTRRCKLASCGSVSVRELSANLSTCSVRVKIVGDQSCGALLSFQSGTYYLDRLVL